MSVRIIVCYGLLLTALVVLLPRLSYAQAQQSPIASNPALSVNTLTLGRIGTTGSSRSAEKANGFHLQEVEIRVSANVDPYFRADARLAFEKEPGEEFELRPEEVFIETLSIPYVSLRIGKFKSYLGRTNLLHTHAFPFIDQPLIYDTILGEEGLNEIGIAAAALLPFPWYTEFVAQALSAENEILFDPDRADAVTGLFYLRTLVDLSDATTLDLTGNYGYGQNSFGSHTHLVSGSSTVRWRPTVHSIYQSLIWTTEYLFSDRQGAPTDRRQGGISSWLQWQFSRRWWAQARFDYTGLPGADAGGDYRTSALLAFVPSEFSAFRLQYDVLDEAGTNRLEHFVTLQLNVTIGAHPAHLY